MSAHRASTIGAFLLFTASALAQPSIRADAGVVNASSYAADIAQGSWFAVIGSAMGPANISIYSGPLPYPTELSGTRVTFTPAAGGTPVEARIWYTLATQIAGLLPSSTSPGDYDARVIYNNQTSPLRRVRVVARNFGFATAAQNGSGPAQATNASLNGGISLVRFTTGSVSFNGRTWQYRPAYPDESLVIWGTGSGPDAQSDLNGGTSGDQTAAGGSRVIVGGMEITPAYAGRSSGSPGLDQINFTLPPNVSTGCTVSLQVRNGGRLSNLGSLAIASRGSATCRHPFLTEQQLRSLDEGGTLTFGAFSVSKTDISLSVPGIGSFDLVSEDVGGAFSRFGADSVAFIGGLSVAQIGDCSVNRFRGGLNDVLSAPTVRALHAGSQLVLNGPGVSNRAIPVDEDNFYGVNFFTPGIAGVIPPSGSPTLGGGTYTLTGSGGREVGAFNAQTSFPASFTWTNRGAISTIMRNQPLPVQWTGGGTGAGAVVTVVGLSGTQVGGTLDDPILEVAVFVCTSAASAGQLTVPAAVTGALPPASGDITAGSIALLGVSADPAPNVGQFTAPLLAGGTAAGQFTYSWFISKSVSVQ